jgi:hypothetical protein
MHVICLAYEEQRILDDLSSDEWRALRTETLDYVEHLRETGRLVDARPLRSATESLTVRVRDGEASVIDGPFAETKEQLGGFFILNVENMDEAVRLASGWPSARFGSIEVRPLDETLSEEKRY